MAESNRTQPPEALDAWADALRERLGFSAEELPVSLILDLARDVANDVTRPAAPLGTFAAGLAAGRRGGSAADIDAVVEEVSQLAETWNGEALMARVRYFAAAEEAAGLDTETRFEASLGELRSALGGRAPRTRRDPPPLRRARRRVPRG